MKIKNAFITLITLFVLNFGCSGAQTRESMPPSMINLDAESITVDASVDYDAYQFTATPRQTRVIFSNPETSVQGEMIAPLNADARAPFPGVLFNGAALARVEVEFRGEQQRCLIDSQADLDRAAAQATRDLQRLQNILRTNSEIYQITLRTRDEENDRLQRLIRLQNTNQNNVIMNYVLIGVGSAIVGAGIAGAAVYFTRP